MKKYNLESIKKYKNTHFKGMKHGKQATLKQNIAYFNLDKNIKKDLPFIIIGLTIIDRTELKKEVNNLLKKYANKYFLQKTIAYELAKQYPCVSSIAFSRELTEIIPKELIVLQEENIVVYKIPSSL